MTAGDSELDAARRSLYGGPRATFVERRTELSRAARGAGDREQAKLIADMRKPSVAAHLVNLLAQTDDSGLQELVELGSSIRGAMATGDDSTTRSLLRGRAAALAATLHHAREIARAHGESVSPTVADQVTQTLRAAMATDDAAAAACSGTLTDALGEPGFEGVDIAAATRSSAPPEPEQSEREPSSLASKRPERARKKADVAAEEDAQEAQRAAAAAAAAAAKERARNEKALAAAVERRDDLARERDRVAARLDEIDDQLSAAQAEVDVIDHRLRDAATD